MYQVEKLINTATGQFKNILTVLLFTGMRLGELVTLKWSDVDFKRKIITISRANQKDGSIDLPKTGKIREIDMLPPVIEALKRQKKTSEYIFVTQYGKRYQHYDTLRDYHFKKLLEKCNIEVRELYQCRHTFASNMLSKGEELIWVSSMLGHSEVTTTLRYYTKYILQRKIKRAKFLEDMKL